MRFCDYLSAEWRPALGCTEPACLAYAASLAARQASGPVTEVRVECDPRMYKNCYAVGIPHSGQKMGIRWALALGAFLPDPSAGLQIFRQITPETLAGAGALLDTGAVSVSTDSSHQALYVDCRVRRAGGEGRAVITGEHTRLVRLERNGDAVPVAAEQGAAAAAFPRESLTSLSFEEMVAAAGAVSPEERGALRQGVEMNLAIARHGFALLPDRLRARSVDSAVTRSGLLVCGGVFARMCGEDFTVMSLAGSGNKGITCAVPLHVWSDAVAAPPGRAEEALALACLVTSATTHHLGTLSAVCGCSNAAGIGLAAGIVYLEQGTPEQISLAVTNMVGNVAGMICDGAKIGCALKTMTAVDSAFRSAFLALSDVGIPVTDGIVGADGLSSLVNLGRTATHGMTAMDQEILAIMGEKMGDDQARA